MAEDWSIDVKKYAPDANDAVIAAIVRHCGIALRSRDASLVSFIDPAETDVVRESFLKKKLGLTDPDSVLDTAIAAVGERMKADTTKNRVTVYYLLAEFFGKLGVFGAEAPAAVAPAPVAAPVAPAIVAAPVAPAVVAAPVAVMAAEKPHRRSAAFYGSGNGLLVGLIALLVAGFALIIPWSHKKPAPVAAPAPMAAVQLPAMLPPQEIPTGAGIVNTEEDGKPGVSIYFDTAKSDIDPKFEGRTAILRQWLADHAGTHLQVSGYNDPRGNPVFNAQLSKSRAFAVRDALIKLGVPATSLDLVKPGDTTDDGGTYAHARRVDVTAEDGPVVAAPAAADPAAPEAAAPEAAAPEAAPPAAK